MRRNVRNHPTSSRAMARSSEAHGSHHKTQRPDSQKALPYIRCMLIERMRQPPSRRPGKPHREAVCCDEKGLAVFQTLRQRLRSTAPPMSPTCWS
jgi:hypothetical protein